MARKGGWLGRRQRNTTAMESVPDGIATKCEKCSSILFAREFERNLKVCNKCGRHHRLNVRERLDMTVDPDSFEEFDAHLSSRDPLGFPEYLEKQRRAEAGSGLSDAIVTGVGRIEGQQAVMGVAEFAFMGGSMGSVVGEKIARAVERGYRRGRLPRGNLLRFRRRPDAGGAAGADADGQDLRRRGAAQ